MVSSLNVMCSQANRLDELARAEREDGVTAPQRIDAPSVFDLGKVAAQVALAQAADLVLVEIADEIAHELGPRVRGRPHAVTQQMLEDVGTVEEASFVRHRARRIRRSSPRSSIRSAAAPAREPAAPASPSRARRSDRRSRRTSPDAPSPEKSRVASPAPPALTARPVPPAPDTQSRCGDREDIHAPRTRVG